MTDTQKQEGLIPSRADSPPQRSSHHHVDTPRFRHPLLLPELLITIAPYLSQPDSCRSARVCRVWHSVFLSRIWSELGLLLDTENKYENPAPQVVEKYKSLVRSVHIQYSAISSNGEQLQEQQQEQQELVQFDNTIMVPSSLSFPNLTVLKISLLKPETYPHYANEVENAAAAQDDFFQLGYKISFPQCWSFLQTRTLEIMQRTISENPTGFCNRLRELNLSNMRLTGPDQWMTLYEHCWSRLDVLALRGEWWSTNIDSRRDESLFDRAKVVALIERLKGRTTTSKIRDLTLESHNCNEGLYSLHRWLVFQCPRVVRLVWGITGYDWFGRRPVAMCQLANAIESSSFSGEVKSETAATSNDHNGQELEEDDENEQDDMIESEHGFQDLKILHLPEAEFEAEDFTVVVQGLKTPLTELNLSRTLMKLASWKALEAEPRHLVTLRSVNVEHCCLPGPALHAMLCSMPNLEQFFADSIHDTDIIRVEDGEAGSYGRPWVCERLRTLHLQFDFLYFSSRRKILSRLAKLNRLEVLRLGGSKIRLGLSPVGFSQPGELGLLDELRTLRWLRDFQGWRDKDHQWGLAEAEWVQRYWPEIQSIDGPHLEKKAKDLLPKILS
ncbi:hypothetical protein BGZ83_009131 [Gryganskiella cystojenkinii]|nr:hypothetical protein BGZ83_009131 [Gryganskiella cystojenkinii]